ncbi:MAG: LON peptidase substrate-binding domain-containing protein [Candidatus Moduliflexus flocculans]|nr:LON peptidase substrate-binding domain-containing protein [Candidatus Moduliflexus flocculans]
MSYTILISPSEVVKKMECQDDPGMVCDIVVSYTTLKTEKKQEILENNHIESRLEKIYEYLRSEIDIARIQIEHERAGRGRRSSTTKRPTVYRTDAATANSHGEHGR